MLQAIPTWVVSIEGDMSLRVPENKMDALTSILVFNRIEFSATRSSEPWEAAKKIFLGPYEEDGEG